MRRRWTALLGSIVLITAWVVGLPPAQAAAPPPIARMTVTSTNTLSWFPRTGEFDESNSTQREIVARADELNVTVRGGTSGQLLSLRIRLERNQRFQIGRTFPGRAGLSADLWFDDRSSCSLGWFDIRDIAYSGNTVVRLDLRFSTYCSGHLLGDLQLGPRVPGVITGVRSLVWPNTPVGTHHPLILPVWVRNLSSAPVTLGAVQRTGAQAAEFPVSSDRCSARTLRVREGCLLEVRFRPAGPGAKAAALSVSAGTQTLRVDLAGSALAGRFSWEVHRGPLKDGTPAVDRLFTDTSSPFFAEGFASSVEIQTTANGRDWRLWLRTPDHKPLKLGTQRFGYAPVDPTLPELTLSGETVTCGASSGVINLKQFTYGPYGEVTRFSASITMNCIEGQPPTSAEISYRATDSPAVPRGPFLLRTGQSLPVGGILRTANDFGERYRLTLHRTGQVVITEASGRRVWASPYVGPAGAYRLSMLPDGSVAILNGAGRAVWLQKPAGARAGSILLLQSDGNLVLHTSDFHPLWAAQPL